MDANGDAALPSSRPFVDSALIYGLIYLFGGLFCIIYVFSLSIVACVGLAGLFQGKARNSYSIYIHSEGYLFGGKMMSTPTKIIFPELIMCKVGVLLAYLN